MSNNMESVWGSLYMSLCAHMHYYQMLVAGQLWNADLDLINLFLICFRISLAMSHSYNNGESHKRMSSKQVVD